MESEKNRVCMECGQEHFDCDSNLLSGMYLSAAKNADRVLSPRGIETRKMLVSASEQLGTIETWKEAAGVEDLEERDIRALESFVARATLIEAAQEMNEQSYEWR
jgi:hypothetical protein